MTEENLICKQQGHDFRYSKLYDGFVCCYCCGVYKDVRELRKEEMIKEKIKKEHEKTKIL